MSVRQAAQLDIAAERAGATAADMDRLAQGDALAQILPFIRGLAIIQMIKYNVNLADAPFCPDGWTVEEHQKGDANFEWDPTKVALYSDEGQKTGVVRGIELREKLKGQRVLNANLLDFLHAHPELIPNNWKGKVVFFWGTIYRESDGSLSVRCLNWLFTKMPPSFSESLTLNCEFGLRNPALVSASSPTAVA
jgi:hypothetical protein